MNQDDILRAREIGVGVRRRRLKSPAQWQADRDAKRKAAANRLRVVGASLRDIIAGEAVGYDQATVTLGETTSNAPLIRLEFPDGDVFHVTVTKARK